MNEVSSFCGRCGRSRFTGASLWGEEQRHLAQPHETQLLALSCLVTASLKLKSFKGEPTSGSRCLILNPKKAKWQVKVQLGTESETPSSVSLTWLYRLIHSHFSRPSPAHSSPLSRIQQSPTEVWISSNADLFLQCCFKSHFPLMPLD